MKGKRFRLVLALSLVISCFVGVLSFASPQQFPDLPAWCSEAVNDMASQNILSGFEDGNFYPDRAMTRAQLAKVLHLIYAPEIDESAMKNDPILSEQLEYTESVNPGSWANTHIALANSISIGEFGYKYEDWAKPATRYEMAHMASQFAAYRLMLDGKDTTLVALDDLIPYIGDYDTFADRPYAKAVLWMYSEGLTNGSDSKGSFNPDATITRGQACVILYRIQNDDAKVSVTTTSTPSIDNAMEFQGGEYKPGSVYGPKLNQTELNEVKAVVESFVSGYITNDMSDYEKVSLAQEFLSQTCSYAPDWSKNQANTAWGALVYHEAQCSGYARALKALCDGMGIGCYYVHADKNASNPSHQFNMVQVNGNWYIVDPQLNDTMGNYWPAFLISGNAYTSLTGVTWDSSGLPECSRNYQR